jgi:hypothetical protein
MNLYCYFREKFIMNSNKFFIFALAFLLIGIIACQRTEQPYKVIQSDNPVHGEIIPGKYIVVFRSDLLPEQRYKIDMDHQQKLDITAMEIYDLEKDIIGTSTVIDFAYFKGVFGFAGELNEDMVSRLKADPRVKSIEPDRYVVLAPPGKGKPTEGGDGSGGPDPQSTPWGVSRVNGGVSPGVGKIAWIIDSGIDLDHPDLNVNVSLSKSFLTGKSANSADDENGHGTHVAGTIAAINNSFGVIGVAAGAEVVSVRTLDRRGSGSLSGVIAGVQYVADNADADDVANMSLGGGISSTLDNAVLAASNTCTFVLAAGNESDDANNHSPARIGDQSTRIHTISAMNINGSFAGFSNYGPDVDYCQPGTNIPSCWKNGGYNTISGTSNGSTTYVGPCPYWFHY